MPRVNAAELNADYQLNLVLTKAIPFIAAAVPDGQGEQVYVILTNLQPTSDKVAKSGLGLFADQLDEAGKLLASHVHYHLCAAKPCRSKAQAVHLGEWAYLAKDESADGDELLEMLHAHRTRTDHLIPETYGISTPYRAGRGYAHSPVTEWANAAGVPELAGVLVRQGIQSRAELAALHDSDINALFGAEPELGLGVRARFRLGINLLREGMGAANAGAALQQSTGWFEQDSSAQLTPDDIRGTGGGSPEVCLWEEAGLGLILRPGRGWVRVARRGTGQGGKAGGAASVSTGGPLAELVAAAKGMLGEGPEVEVGRTVEEPAEEPVFRDRAGWGSGPPGMGQAKVGSTAVEESRTVGGRLKVTAGSRAPGRAVALKVGARQAPGIWEEWTGCGTVRLEETVAGRSWRSVENKRAAFGVARMLDVMHDSGLLPYEEPAGEVALREIAAYWILDRHPKEADLADFLRESAMSTFGVPKSLWEEARAFRKLVGRGAAQDPDA